MDADKMAIALSALVQAQGKRDAALAEYREHVATVQRWVAEIKRLEKES